MYRFSVRYPIVAALAALAVAGAMIPASGFGGDVYTVGTFPAGGGFLACYRPAVNGVNPAAPLGFFAGPNTTLTAPSGVTASLRTGRFYATDLAANAVDEWSLPCPNGARNVAPVARLTSAQIASPVGIAVEVSGRSALYVANSATNSIALFNITAHGNTHPGCVLGGAATGLNSPEHIVVEPNVRGAPHPGYLYVANQGDASIRVFPPTPCGNIAPAGLIQGPMTQLNRPVGVDTYFDGTSMVVYVADPGAQKILEYRDEFGASNRPPLRVLGGPASMLSCPDDVRVSATNFDVYVVDPCAMQIDVFKKTAGYGQPPIAWYKATNPGDFVDDAVGIWLEDRN